MKLEYEMMIREARGEARGEVKGKAIGEARGVCVLIDTLLNVEMSLEEAVNLAAEKFNISQCKVKEILEGKMVV